MDAKIKKQLKLTDFMILILNNVHVVGISVMPNPNTLYGVENNFRSAIFYSR